MVWRRPPLHSSSVVVPVSISLPASSGAAAVEPIAGHDDPSPALAAEPAPPPQQHSRVARERETSRAAARHRHDVTLHYALSRRRAREAGRGATILSERSRGVAPPTALPGQSWSIHSSAAKTNIFGSLQPETWSRGAGPAGMTSSCCTRRCRSWISTRLTARVSFLGRRLRLPLIIAGMTGGTPTAETVNAVLASAAESFGIALGVGSQRPALRSLELAGTYRVARRNAPTAFLIANVGAPQLVAQDDASALTHAEICDAVDMIEADALAVHLNFLQELVQPEGDHRARGCAQAIAALAASVRLPVIAKETGGGMTRRTAVTLSACGVAAIDVGGRGGTSFAAVEGLRAAAAGDSLHQDLGYRLSGVGHPDRRVDP